ncbi:class I SAM-dependent methyltransferase [Amphiplicatus metriothermophilus]|uniref:Predicted methyltransferase n=1 Tax=Amphiplicatus metriothermophilus TaxID=1519374 RepID=A0A239PQH7_9PROT|nr:class I SAM-dependent methyltransferase [Amphiplicatus metriothermophilus]MBB5518640.1 putative methyltransferase [Amphiplicatus metriothermophilus]SNT72202.1 Predicted methyltransferase [Amphiplicatus metriothermophilus]
MLKYMLAGVAAAALVACSQETPVEEPAAPVETETTAPSEPAMMAEEKLDAVLAAQPDDVKARYQWRHPRETLQFFGVEPGMTVVEALPGGGWYSKILIPYLGADGHLIGASYAMEMWPLFGGFATEEFIEGQRTWPVDWPAQMREAVGEGAKISAFQFGSMPAAFEGKADVVLFIRALHNMARFEDEGGFLTQGLADAYAVLKPGGIVGVVQHRAPEDSPDEWASGDAGYLKQSALIARFEEAGFEFVGASEINANPNDQPTTDDIVWRLPPTLGTSREDPELRAQMEAIGESDRMTLKFRKPE